MTPTHFRYGALVLVLMPALLAGLLRAQDKSPKVRSAPAPSKPASPPTKFRVVGYLPEYRMAALDPDVGKFCTDLVYFSAEPEVSGALNRERLKDADIQRLQEIKARYGTALLLCVGGWGHCAGFAPMAASPAARTRFAADVTRFCRDNRFDGVDLDWEHPADAAQRRNYALLMTELRRAFAPRGLRLSVAVAAWQVVFGDDFRAADSIHLMAYDAAGRHSTPEYAASSVQHLREKGVPAARILLGVPFYGTGIKSRASQTYAEIVQAHHPAPDVDEVDDIYFNNIATIERKTRFALDNKLGGIMIWEVGQDTRDAKSLLRAIDRARKAAAKR